MLRHEDGAKRALVVSAWSEYRHRYRWVDAVAFGVSERRGGARASPMLVSHRHVAAQPRAAKAAPQQAATRVTKHASPHQHSNRVLHTTSAQPQLVLSLSPGTYFASAACPLQDNGTRFNCGRADYSYSEIWAQPRWPKRPLDRFRFRHVVAANSSLYFVGDSSSEQHARAAACALFGIDARPTASQLTAAACWTSTASVSQARVCYVQAGKGSSDRSTRAAFDAILRVEGLLRGAVFVVNEGLWYRVDPSAVPSGDSGRYEPSLAASAAELTRVRQWQGVDVEALTARSSLLIWRETAAQHFGTPSGIWPGRPGLSSPLIPRGNSSCRPLLGNASAVQRAYNAAVLGALPRGMHVLPAFEDSLAAWRSHVERHTPHSRAVRGTDCTHFVRREGLRSRRVPFPIGRLRVDQQRASSSNRICTVRAFFAL